MYTFEIRAGPGAVAAGLPLYKFEKNDKSLASALPPPAGLVAKDRARRRQCDILSGHFYPTTFICRL
jgi:hypothetical protein